MVVEVKGGNCFCSNLDWITSCTLILWKFSFKWTEQEEKETGYIPERFLITPLTQHCIYYPNILPTFCSLVLSPSKNTKAREKKSFKWLAVLCWHLSNPVAQSNSGALDKGSPLSRRPPIFGRLPGLQGCVLRFCSFQKPIFKSPVAVWSQHQA